MNWLFKLNNFFRIWGATFRAMGRFKIWIPLIFLLLIKIVLLYQLVRFYEPPGSLILVPLLKAILGDRALHYPHFYTALPFVYNLFNLVLIGFFDIIVNAVVIWLLSSHFWGRMLNIKEAFGKVKGRFGQLFLIWLVSTVVVAAFLILPGILFSSWTYGSPRRMIFIQSLSFVTGVLVSGLFAYCFNLILLSNQSWLKSLASNFAIYRRNFFTTSFFIGIPSLISWVYGALVSNTPLWLSKFRPEIIPLLLGLGSVLNLLVVFWILGALTRLFLYEIKEAGL